LNNLSLLLGNELLSDELAGCHDKIFIVAAAAFLGYSRGPSQAAVWPSSSRSSKLMRKVSKKLIVTSPLGKLDLADQHRLDPVAD